MPERANPDHQQALPELPQPNAALKKLSILVGEWHTNGELVASTDSPGDSSDDTSSRLQAVDTYEWLPGEFFLLHRAAGELGGARVDALEVFGYDAERQQYFSHAFDNQGTAKHYSSTLEGKRWEIDGESERFRGEFGDDEQTLAGVWEQRATDGQWVPWLRISLVKAH